MKKFLYFLALITGLLYMIVNTAIGSNPDGQRLTMIEQSPQYNRDAELFENISPITLGFPRPWYEVMYDLFFHRNERRPVDLLPEDPPSISALSHKAQEIRFIWFGHSTILLEIDKQRILIDPVFSDYASPLPGIAKRFQPPVLTIDEIPEVDIVLISHDHYDHLDHKTIAQLKDRNMKFIAPLGVGAHLEYWGINAANITELDWWENIKVNGLKFTCTPSQHFSGRGMFNRNTTLWASWAVKGKTQNVFFSGDSGYSNHYKKIGKMLGPFDLAFLENGAYNVDWQFVHQLPEEGVQANKDLQSKIMVPIHWGMFDLSLHSWYDPIERVTSEADKQGINLIAPKLGQLVSIKQSYLQESWWQPLIENSKNANKTKL